MTLALPTQSSTAKGAPLQVAQPTSPRAAAVRLPPRCSGIIQRPKEIRPKPSVYAEKLTFMGHLKHMLWSGYDTSFHIANALLFGSELALFNVRDHFVPGTSDRCLANPNLLGCFAVNEHKPIPDEIGLPMLFIGLVYTGWVGATAMKKLKDCRSRLMGLGFSEEELKGMTHYFVLRKVEEMALRHNLESAKEYLRKVKEVYSFEIRWTPKEGP
mmetsp:Transcript_4389/g.15736  ORF Transcript_4389/g.15736 Transcript_4389/m.15736 type:complete len:214 (+) Transcript_4389:140-781(+)